MWRFLKARLWPSRPVILPPQRVIDFTRPRKDHWASFQGGDVFDADFTICGKVAKGDEIRVRMRSGRIARFVLFSCRRDFSLKGDWKVKGCAVGYWTPPHKIKGLLGDGTGRILEKSNKLALIPSGFTEQGSEFWKILAQHEANRDRANSVRTTGNL